MLLDNIQYSPYESISENKGQLANRHVGVHILGKSIVDVRQVGVHLLGKKKKRAV